ncbi:hypothetical protein [Candidatus Poriferisodalis sp.]|uniref:hypothetical protein n=1 Tax=Candidatus Poriferisodalis sp. TaxID=3101277 RepID=UPI003B5CA42F
MTTSQRRVTHLLSGWTVVAVICVGVFAVWAPDLDLPLGNSDDGRIFGRAGLQARNYWELGPVESRFGAVMDPYIRAEFEIPPRTDPPPASVTYAHHPPLRLFITIASIGVFGDNLPALRITDFLIGAATVALMAALLRVVGMSWGPTLLAVLVMSSTGFFYVFARHGISFSLLLALTATVAKLRQLERPPRWALAGAAALAAFTALHSWIAIASLGLLVPWLFIGTIQRRRQGENPGSTPPRSLGQLARLGWSPSLVAIFAGAVAGGLLTAAWLLNATDISELSERIAFRTGTDVSTAIEQRNFSFGEFLSRQWRFASHELMTSWWLRLLLLPALVAAFVDRRTRGPALVTLAVAASLTFVFQQGAWIHRLWNFPWLAPTVIGVAALADWVRRALKGPAAKLRWPLGLAAAVVPAITLAFVVTGPTRDFYLTDPADAGAVLERATATAPEVAEAELIWITSGLSTARWASYYLDLPVWSLDESKLDDVIASDLVLLRNDRIPEFVPEAAMANALAIGESYTLITAEELVE